MNHQIDELCVLYYWRSKWIKQYKGKYVSRHLKPLQICSGLAHPAGWFDKDPQSFWKRRVNDLMFKIKESL